MNRARARAILMRHPSGASIGFTRPCVPCFSQRCCRPLVWPKAATTHDEHADLELLDGIAELSQHLQLVEPPPPSCTGVVLPLNFFSTL
uniref:Uncharacterized protein n=1 Tax=Arundo donax TaxID=35708 RepID=A0A0A9FPC2_ARUDO